MARGIPFAVLALAAPLVALLPAVPSAQAASSSEQGVPPAVLRVNQQGWLPRETKLATLMSARPIGSTTFTVVGDHGRVVLRGTVPSRPDGSWSPQFPDVYRIDLSRLRTSGRYRLQTSGAVSTSSPPFRIAGAEALYGPLVSDGVAFDQGQRDGAQQVPGPLDRQPSHLLDQQSSVYAWPHMARGEDVITDP